MQFKKTDCPGCNSDIKDRKLAPPHTCGFLLEVDERPYFHELPQEKVDELFSNDVSVQFVIDSYLQPDWCGYHEALNPLLGCWSLTGFNRTSISEKYCRGCYCFKSYIK